MMNIRVVRLFGLPRIKIGLIAWNIYTDISNIDEKYENLYLLFQKNFECMLNNSSKLFLNFFKFC